MDFNTYIREKKALYLALIAFIDKSDDYTDEYKKLIDIIDTQNLLQDEKEYSKLILLIITILDNHPISSDIFNKLEQLFIFLIKYKPLPTSSILPEDHLKYEHSKKYLFFLFKKGFIKPSDSFLSDFKSKKYTNMQNYHYFYPSIKNYLDKSTQKDIEEEIFQLYNEKIESFEEKCLIGENDSIICSLIRSDSIEEFIIHINKNCIQLSSKISPSIYETNLIFKKPPTLIEYASFFGSIQIIQYLMNNGIGLKELLLTYSIHSNNSELISLFEENIENIKNIDYEILLNESICCHHNEVADYFKYKLFDIDKEEEFKFNSNSILSSYNYYYFPDNFVDIIQNIGPYSNFYMKDISLYFTTLSIPSSVTSIKKFAFADCKSLTSISLPSSLKEIDNYAFYKCVKLQKFEIPPDISLKFIGKGVFQLCSSLSEFTINSTITSIEDYTFFG